MLIVSAVEGVQAHTETIWNLLRKNNIPTLIFINKLDRVGADIKEVFSQIENNLTEKYLKIQRIDGLEENFNETIDLLVNEEFYNDSTEKVELIEKFAEINEEVLEKYLEGEEITREFFIDNLKKSVEEGEVFPVLFG